MWATLPFHYRFHAINGDFMLEYFATVVVHGGLEVIFLHHSVQVGVGLVVNDNAHIHLLGAQRSIFHPVVLSDSHNQLSSEPHKGHACPDHREVPGDATTGEDVEEAQ